MVIASGNQGLYDALIGLHVVCALVGFGSVAINGAYGAVARRPLTTQTSEETTRFFRSRSYGGHLILAVPVFGFAALAFRPGGADYGAVWVVAGLLIWVVAAGLLLGVVGPAQVTLSAHARLDEPGDDPSVRRAGSRLLWASAATDVLFVVALGFMVTQAR